MQPSPASAASPTLRPACRECRARKVRCDRTAFRCGPCTRLELSCSYTPAPPQTHTRLSRSRSIQQVTQAGFARRRVRRACDACRVLKARCSGRQPCSRCHSRNLACVFPAGTTDDSPSATISANADTHTASPPSTSPQHPAHQQPADTADIVAFFDSLGTSPVSVQFLHRATVLADHSQGRLDPLLASTLCALGRLGSLEQEGNDGSDEQRAAARSWMAHVGRLVVLEHETRPLARLQALILVLQHQITWSQVTGAWTLVAVGARLALTLRLNYELPSLDRDPIVQETRRRMVWAIWLIDKLLAGGIEDLVVLPTDRIHIRLPCDLHIFERGIASRAGRLLDSYQSAAEPQHDALGFYIQQMECRHRILNYNKRVVRHGSPLTTEDLESLQAQLSVLHRALPQYLQLTPARLRLKAHSHDLAIYVALHIAHFQSQCNLYRLFVPGMREAAQDDVIRAAPPELIVTCQSACLLAAGHIANLLAQLYRTGFRKPLAIPNLVVGIHQISQITHGLRNLLGPTDRSGPALHKSTVQADLQDAASMVRILQPPQLRGSKAAEMLNEADYLISALADTHVSGDHQQQQQQQHESSWPGQSRTRHLASKGSFLDDVEVEPVTEAAEEDAATHRLNLELQQAGESLVSLQQQQHHHNRRHGLSTRNQVSASSNLASSNNLLEPLWQYQDIDETVAGQNVHAGNAGRAVGVTTAIPWDPLDVQLYGFFDPVIPSVPEV